MMYLIIGMIFKYQYKLENGISNISIKMQSFQNQNQPQISLKQISEKKKYINANIKPVVRNQLLLYLWSICIAMGSLVMGYLFVIVTVISSTMTYYAQSQSNVKQKQYLNMPLKISICTTALPLGGLISSLAYKKILNKIQSQNRLMTICDALMIIAILVQLMSLDIFVFTFTRLLQGIIIGISGIVVPTYLISISPTKASGKIGSLNQILITVGIALGYAMGYKINELDLGNIYNWRLCVLIPVPICIVRIIACKLFPMDTLERHIQNREWTILKDYIDQFYQKDTFNLKALILSKNMSIPFKNNKVTQTNVENDSIIKETSSIEEDSPYSMNDSTSKNPLVLSSEPTIPISSSPKNYNQSTENLKLRKILSFVLCILNQFCGINAILFYSNQFFLNISHGDSHYAVRKSLQLGIFQIIITLISGGFMDNFGRRTLMLCGDFLIIIALLSGYYILDLDVSSQWDPNFVTYAIFLHIGGFSLSLGPVTVVYISQILQDISPYMTFIWIETIFIALSSNIMIEAFGIGKVFLFYALVSIAGLSYVYKYMIQTKGKTRNQIIQTYEKLNNKSQHIKGNDEQIALALANQRYVKVFDFQVKSSSTLSENS